MKTTLNLSDGLVARAKALATKERITLTKMIEEGLVLRLRRQKSRAPRKFKELPVSTPPAINRCLTRLTRDARRNSKAIFDRVRPPRCSITL